MEKINEEKINEVLNWVTGIANNSTDFVLEQAPLYAQELIAYTLTINTVVFIIGIVLIIIAISCLIASTKKTRGFSDDVLLIIALHVTLISAFCLMCSVPNLIKIKTAPRVFIMDHIRNI